MGHPWFSEAIAVVRRHPHVYADVSALVTRRWLLYQALVGRSSTASTHKLLFGTDFPFFTARQTIDGLRSVTGEAFGPGLPVIDAQVVEDIIHRPTLDLLGITVPADGYLLSRPVRARLGEVDLGQFERRARRDARRSRRRPPRPARSPRRRSADA